MKTDPKAIGARIKKVLEKKGLTQRALADLLGVTDPTVSAYIRGTSGIPAEVYSFLSELGDVSIDWLINGRVFTGSATYVSEAQEEYTVTMPVRTMAGAGQPHCIEQLEPIGYIRVEPEYDGPNIQVVKIRGTSMEPSIVDGAHVGIDVTDKEVISGQMYAVYMPHEGIVVKRIWIGPELVKIRSDNPQAPDHDMSIDRINWDTFVQGRVKWVLQKY